MLSDAIASFLDGRIRFRHAALHDPDVAARLHDYLTTSLPGVRSARVNSRTGSLLLEYDPEVLDRSTLLDLAARAESLLAPVREGKGETRVPGESRPVRHRAGRVSARRALNRSMLVTLAASVLFGALGRERAHVALGAAFAALSTAHLYSVRKCL